jgi:hypothetical protein
MAFRTPAELRAASQALVSVGFQLDALTEYTPEEMRMQADSELDGAGLMASFGYELDLLRIHKDLAEQGCSFLIVDAPKPHQASLVANMLRAMQPAAAQRYGRFLIEDLTETSPGQGASSSTLLN